MEFIFEMPTKIVAGANCIVTHSELLRRGKTALIVTGKSSAKKNGAYADVVAALTKEKITHILFDQVEENPSLETLERAKNMAATADFVIGIGGGSPLDAAKGIAIMLKHPDIGADNLIGGEKLDAVPVIAVPTTAGTGSEVTQYAIFTDHKRKTKINYGHKVFPEVAFLDATYMLNMPLGITRYTALDALSHLVESYLNTKSNAMSEVYVRMGLELLATCFKPLLSGNLSLEIRQKLLLASTYGGIAIAQTGTSLPHTCGYSLTYYENMPHGASNAILYRAYLQSFENQERVNDILQWLNQANIDELGDIIELLLAEYKIHCLEQDLKKYTDITFSNKTKLTNHPENATWDMIFDIYKKSVL
ncbi:iron-containing alcohol dehydrogenase family protein [Candidatus Epulonipiscium viviparus]|uniref:iron-containing alcohol dehydrogenase family protein n=1 Tax=Candidatus Epulonipiscium viviparus TaxID=420336 RepID=UPI0027380911|nr:iron-containing alcohol dehydrogenase family protein [Candidatus Epulopiscium viviparus]